MEWRRRRVSFFQNLSCVFFFLILTMLLAIFVDIRGRRKIEELKAKMHLNMLRPSQSITDAAKAKEIVKLAID